jgi:hypothetical protein
MPGILGVITQQNSALWQALGETLTPAEGPRAVVTNLNFATYESYLIDAENIFGSSSPTGVFSAAQSIYIDASGTDNQVSVTVGKTGQVITAKGRTQGWYPLCAPNIFNLIVSCSDVNAQFVCIITNYFVPPAVWPTQ